MDGNQILMAMWNGTIIEMMVTEESKRGKVLGKNTEIRK
jgi:hypothetical protein